MERGDTPPNWADLYRYSSEFSTDESVNLALEWISGMVSHIVKYGMPGSTSSSTANRITDPFAVVDDQLSGTASNKYIPIENNYVNSTHGTASKGESTHSSPSGLKQKDAAYFCPDANKPKDVKDRVVFISNLEDAFEAMAEENSEPYSEDELFRPKRVNLNEAGIRRSYIIRKKKER